jgi:hypothetical protein
MSERFAASVADVEGFPSDRIAVNRSATALFGLKAELVGAAVCGFGHGWLGSEVAIGIAFAP